jgi:hypothetical protein
MYLGHPGQRLMARLWAQKNLPHDRHEGVPIHGEECHIVLSRQCYAERRYCRAV